MVDRLDPRRRVSVCAAINPPSPLARTESRTPWSSAVYPGDLTRRLSLSTCPCALTPIYSLSISYLDAARSAVQLPPLRLPLPQRPLHHQLCPPKQSFWKHLVRLFSYSSSSESESESPSAFWFCAFSARRSSCQPCRSGKHAAHPR